ncbi:hypothetical protein G6F42_013738 [Rhizopus arrhizus]|nr:hypothetical protein G6F42_013738 [Rhizopus arrhizus]
MVGKLEKLAVETNQLFILRKSRQIIIPCYVHVVNLVSRDTIENSVSSYNIPSFDHHDNRNNELVFAYDDDERANNDDDSKATALAPVQKLRLGCKTIIEDGSPLKHQFNKSENDVNHMLKLQLKNDCPTRWNSTRDMIERYLLMKVAYKYTVQFSATRK